jgi:Zn-finger protein
MHEVPREEYYLFDEEVSNEIINEGSGNRKIGNCDQCFAFHKKAGSDLFFVLQGFRSFF